MIASRIVPMPGTSATLALLFAVLGLIIGTAVDSVVTSYNHDQSFWPRLHQHRSRIARLLLIQIVVAATYAGLAIQYAREPLLLAVAAIESGLLIALLFIDLDARLVPTVLMGVVVVLALASATTWPGLGVARALLGGAVGFAVFGLLVALARLVFGEGALGMGDVNLALAIGCMTGYPLVVATLTLGILLGGLGAGIVLLLHKGGLRRTMPYGPALIIAVLIVLVHGNTMRPFCTF